MENTNIEKIAQALEWFTFLVMIIAAALFVQNSFQNYQSNSTGIKVLSKNVEDYVSPTITLCFKPYRKSSILQEFGLDWPVQFQNMSYKIGKDFKLTFWFDNYGTADEVTIDDIILTQKASKLIELEEMITTNAGICYSLTPKNKIGKGEANVLQIQFDDSLPFEDVPKKIKVIFTSKQNSYGAINTLWKDGQEYSIFIDPEKKDYNMAALKSSQHERLEISSGCVKDDFYWKCVSKR